MIEFCNIHMHVCEYFLRDTENAAELPVFYMQCLWDKCIESHWQVHSF